MIHSSQPNARTRLDAAAPTVLRSDTFAKQSSLGATVTAYTQNPRSARYEGGTAPGGEWLFPPEVGGEDYGADFVPAGRSISSSVFGMGPGVSLGFGLPDLSTGGIRTGYSLRDSGGDLVCDRFDSTGAKTENFRMTASGAIRFRVLSGDPAAPPAGYIDVYSKTGDLYQIDSASTVTKVTN